MTDKTIVAQNQQDVNAAIVERVVVTGDLSKLTPEERVRYYRAVCQSTGLNPLTRPFDYITLNGRLILYARKDATDQLRKIHGVSIEPPQITYAEDLVLVTVTARDDKGRTDSELGAVSLVGLKGVDKANAIMKAITKSKRRVTLSIVGLGWLDETEVETIADAKPAMVDTETGEIKLATAPVPAPQPGAPGPIPTTQPATPQSGTPCQGTPETPHWTKFAKEREAFEAWRSRNVLSDGDCKRLAGAYLGWDHPLGLFREFPGTREELQAAIESQIARQQQPSNEP